MWDSSHAHTHYTINQIVANPWNPISPREAHWDVLIRSDLPLMCRGLFPQLLCALRENKTVKGMGPKADNIFTVRAGLLQWL